MDDEYSVVDARADVVDSSADPGDERGHASDTPMRETGDVLAWRNVDYSGQKDTDPNGDHLDANNTVGIAEELTGQTTFNPNDVQGGNWEWLAKLNSGYGESDRSKARDKAGTKRDVTMVVDRLGGTSHHRERAQWLLDRLDCKEQLLQRGDMETMIVGVVSMVMDEDRTARPRQFDGTWTTSVTRDAAFAALLDDLGVVRSDVRLVRKRLRATDVYVSPNGL